jgi:acetylornithine deacetylase/succinyl-diaminopimelate desuccinylase-like protein
VARLAAIHAYRAVRGDLPLRVRMAAEGEEEIGSPHLEEFVDRFESRLREADACVWEGGEINLAGQLKVEMGVKGMVYVEFNATGPNRDMHSMYGGVVPNPAWQLVRMLNDLVSVDGHINIPGFYDDIRDPDDATLRITDSYPFDETAEMQSIGIRRWQRGLTGKGLVRELVLRPTANIAGFHSGYGGEGSKTVLPSRAMLKMDFRLVPDQDPRAIEKSLRRWLDENGYAEVSTTFMTGEHASRGSAEHPLVRAMVRAGEMVGLECVLLPNSPGTGPMYVMCDRLGLPAVSGEGVGRSTAQIHSPNEHIHIEDYHRSIKQFAAFLEEYAKN